MAQHAPASLGYRLRSPWGWGYAREERAEFSKLHRVGSLRTLRGCSSIDARCIERCGETVRSSDVVVRCLLWTTPTLCPLLRTALRSHSLYLSFTSSFVRIAACKTASEIHCRCSNRRSKENGARTTFSGLSVGLSSVAQSTVRLCRPDVVSYVYEKFAFAAPLVRSQRLGTIGRHPRFIRNLREEWPPDRTPRHIFCL